MATPRKIPAVIKEAITHSEGIKSLLIAPKQKCPRFYPGQFLHLAMDPYDPSYPWPESRVFSIASSPTSDLIRIIFTVKGDFTKKMYDCLKPWDEVWLKLPYGDLFQQGHDKTNTIFIAGGTGITPFLSLFNHESFAEYSRPKIYLGFRTKAYHIYDKEISESTNPDLAVTSFYQDTDGVIDINRIFLENGKEASYFISGSPAMIKNFKKILIKKGVPPQHVLTDDWE